MNRFKTYWHRVLLIGILCIFSFVQAASTADAMRYGDKPHRHNGKVCVLSLATHNDEQLAVLPDEPDTAALTPLRFAITFHYSAGSTSCVAHAVSIATSARSPPKR